MGLMKTDSTEENPGSRRVFSIIATMILVAGTILGQIAGHEKPGGRERTVTSTGPIDTAVASTQSRSVWQMTGPFGGDVISLAIDPHNSDLILIGTKDGQIFRSTDGGAIWKRLRPALNTTGYALTVILFDPTRRGRVYVGANEANGGGVFVSENGGESWRELEGIRNRGVLSMVQAVKDPSVLAIASREGIFRTRDRGATWQKITPENDPELRNFHSVAIDPRDVDILYAGTTHLPWKTTDGGESWKRAGSKESGMIDDSDIFAIHIDEENPDVVLMSACSGIYRSANATKQWAKIQGIPSTSRRTHVIYQHPSRPAVLFAGTTEGLWRSPEGGKPESWSRVTPLRLVINAVAVHPDRPDRIFLGTDDHGVLVSSDGGESYDPSNAGFISRQVRTVLADRAQRNRVYAGVLFDGANGGLFVSNNGGITWQQSMRGMGVRDVYSIHQSPLQAATLFAGTNHGVFRSDDHGRTWAKVKKEVPEELQADPDQIPAVPPSISSSSRPSVTLVVQKRTKSKAKRPTARKGGVAKAPAKKPQPVTPPKPDDGLVNLESQVFKLAAFTPSGETEARSLLAVTWDGLFVTEDEKKGWRLIKITDASGEVISAAINTLATHPLAPGVIWIGTEDGLFISSDDGKTFRRLRVVDEAQRIKAIAFDPRRLETVYIGTATGFFRSTDGGRNFERRGGGMPEIITVSAVEVSSSNADEVYVSDYGNGNFYFSRDSGRTWEPLDISSLPSRRFWALATDPFERNRLYAGSFSGGVYVLNRQSEATGR